MTHFAIYEWKYIVKSRILWYCGENKKRLAFR